jgi:hypothetical protein
LQENIWYILALQLLQLLQQNAAIRQPTTVRKGNDYCTNRRVNRDEYFYFLEKKVCLTLPQIKKLQMLAALAV